jgi:hypothetical protein
VCRDGRRSPPPSENSIKARALADKLPDAEAKRRMLKLVGDYEELAKRAEKRLRETQKSLP